MAACLLDELVAGFLVVDTPEVRRAFGVDYRTAALIIFVIPTLASLLLEPPLMLWSDRARSRKWFVSLGMVGSGVGFVLAAAAAHPAWLCAAICLIYVCDGMGVGLSQATLIDAEPQRRERVMTWWVISGSIGDTAAPLALALFALVGAGWRHSFVVAGALLLLHGWWMSRQSFPTARADDDEDEESPPWRVLIRDAFANRRMLLWLWACSTCGLMDEILVAFGALYLRDTLGASETTRDLTMAAFALGALVGALVLDRALARYDSRRLLVLSALGCAVAYVGWWSTGAPWAMFAVGVFTGPLYPILKANAYAAAPERAGTVSAFGHLFTPFELAVPFVIGWVADAHGLSVALGLLLAQPVAVLIALYISRPARAS